MVGLGTGRRRRTRSPCSPTWTPLGLTVGNAIEVRESVEVLAGGGPADVVELTVALAREMLAGGRPVPTSTRPRSPTARPWTPGGAMIAAQGGDPAAALPTARETHVVTAPTVGGADPARRAAGRHRRLAARRRARPQGGRGAGRRRRRLARAPGDAVGEGQPLFTLLSDDANRFARALDALAGGYDVGDAASYDPTPLVLDRIS